ncbi:HAD hydrolase family protein [Candidatus Binatia bacterium]|nr:HAD hydrolase family protein [Candidatus Binatia bacterium]
MRAYFRAVAVDYDGTLNAGGRPSEEVLKTLQAVRHGGCRCILVTGRILTELRTDFPDCADHFDLLVVENGAVVATGSLAMPLVSPVPAEVDAALDRLGIHWRRGDVIVAAGATHAEAILRSLREDGADCQLVRNRGELMILPAGVSKATGLRYALLQLGISPHSTIAIGDAENDLAMLEACELGVAVENAVDTVKARADLVLSEPNGAGVMRFLRDGVLQATLPPAGRRWQITLGRSSKGAPVRLPSAAVDIVVTGGSGSGKSFAAGLIAEQLVQLGYVVCVIDPEGDHAPLGRLPNVVTLGGHDHAPAVEDLARIFEQSGTSVVVDLSLVPALQQYAWTLGAIDFLERRRAQCGMPHWLIIDEAHTALGAACESAGFDERLRGHCLVTYRPDELAELVTRSVDYVLLVAGPDGIDPVAVGALSTATGLAPMSLGKELHGVGLGEAILVRVGAEPPIERLRFAPRWVAHVRHWHKYSSAQLPAEGRFYFRGPAGLTGAAAGNMEEFHREVRRATAGTLQHHAAFGDFSRWVTEVIQDRVLAGAVRRSEARISSARSSREREAGRRELLAAVEQRYETSAPAALTDQPAGGPGARGART